VVLRGSGGHTARPHLTQDIVFALGQVITELPGLLSRLVDPRAAMSLVWGSVDAGKAANAIPAVGRVRGTLRVFDRQAWDDAGPLVRRLVDQIVAASGAQATTTYTRGVPPVHNAQEAVDVQREAIVRALGEDAVAGTEQSMGGEDFAWYLEATPGALARLGVSRPGQRAFDLHQGTFDIDETALDIGVRYTVMLAHAALERLAAAQRAQSP
jgi:amidohydrolase